MARISTRQFSFSNGEVSRSVWGRADMEFYYASLAHLENWVIDQTGALHRRPGTEFDLVTDEPAALYDFQTDDGRSIVIIAQPDYFMFLVDGAVVQDGGSDFQLAHTYGVDYQDLIVTPDLNAAYISHINHPDRVIDVAGAVFEINDLAAYPFGRLNNDQTCKLLLSSGGSTGSNLAAVEPMDETVGTNVYFTKPATVLSAEEDFSGTVVENIGGDVCIVQLAANRESGSYRRKTDATYTTEVGVVDLRAKLATVRSTGCAPFTADMIGQRIRILDEDGKSSDDAAKNTWLTLEVIDVVSTSEAVLDYEGVGITATDLFQLPLVVDGKTTSCNHIMDDRLWLGVGNIVAGSEAQNFLGFKPTDESGNVNPDNSIKKNVGSAGAVVWMATMGRQLVVGCKRGLLSLLGAGVSGAFQADGTAQQKNDRISCANSRPVEVGEGLMFIDATRRKLYRTAFTGQYEQVKVSDASLFADHFGAERFFKITYQESPFSIVWVVTDKGRLLSHTVWPDQGVAGWARHRLGGSLIIDGVEDAPRVNAVMSVAGDASDVIYLAVQRTINGEDVHTIEHMSGRFDSAAPIEDAVLLDCSLPVVIPDNSGIVASFKDGPVVPTALDNGIYATTDGATWVDFTVSEGIATAEAPNTQDEPIPGRDFVSQDGENWARLGAAPEGGDPEFVNSDYHVFRPPIGVKETRLFIETASGVDHLEGETISVHVDGRWEQQEVIDGDVPIGGCVARVGLAYDSILAFLPTRVRMGSTDGANDPVKVIEGAALVKDVVNFECGSGSRDEYWGQTFAYEPAEIPEFDDLIRKSGWAGWLPLRPFGELTDNADSLISCRVRGPYPCTISNVELTIDAQGGR